VEPGGTPGKNTYFCKKVYDVGSEIYVEIGPVEMLWIRFFHEGYDLPVIAEG
jgi:hypothetical protein